MELLLSNFPPINLAQHSSRTHFEKAIKDCETVRIASGYVSSDSLIELKRIIEINRKPRLELLIGMHFFDGFTHTQYLAACELNTFLLESNLGFVHLSNLMKFHGKMYAFINGASYSSAIVGSSNLGSIYDKVNRLYEADILLEGNEAEPIGVSISKIVSSIGSPLESINITKFNTYNSLLENHENVLKVESDELAKIKEDIISISFKIPVKTEPKSGLNAFFGKGRIDKRNYEMPRPWYEAEIIVSNKTTKSYNYPAHKTFTVYTDDGWSFKCDTNGDYGKNFRSKDDLKILGKWIKGRLENNGALKIGYPVNESVLAKYGRDFIQLTATKKPDVWFLDFATTV